MKSGVLALLCWIEEVLEGKKLDPWRGNDSLLCLECGQVGAS